MRWCTMNCSQPLHCATLCAEVRNRIKAKTRGRAVMLPYVCTYDTPLCHVALCSLSLLPHPPYPVVCEHSLTAIAPGLLIRISACQVQQVRLIARLVSLAPQHCTTPCVVEVELIQSLHAPARMQVGRKLLSTSSKCPHLCEPRCASQSHEILNAPV